MTIVKVLAFMTVIVAAIPVRPANAAVVPAASCFEADVQAAVLVASTGDTVTIPAGTCKWTSNLNITKAITLQGVGVGSTIIQDGVATGPLISWTCLANSAHRLTGFEFRDGGRVTQEYNGIIAIHCTDNGTTTFRVDNNKFDHLNGVQLNPWNTIGVIDHNMFLTYPTRIPIYAFNPSWNGIGDNGDNSWHADVIWGSSAFLFVENNTFSYDSGTTYACWDNFRGFRGVARFNTLNGCSFENHGTESGQRNRGMRAVEIYNNSQNAGNTITNLIADIRSGSALVWGNAWSNVTPGYVYSAASFVDDRTTYPFRPWGIADGTNLWDLNDPSNPYASFTASSGGTDAVKVIGAGWTTNQWYGYVIKKTSTCSNLSATCSSLVLGNTSDTIAFSSTNGFGADLTFSNGDTFNLNKMAATIDQPGRGGGSLLSVVNCTSLASTGTFATVTCGSHGFSSGDYVSIQDANNGNSGYTGTYRITVIDTNTFIYTCGIVCGTSTSGFGTRVPGFNDQVNFAAYEWLNSINGANVHFSLQTTSFATVRENANFYNYTTAFDGTVGVGVGTLANRPAKCTSGVAYWATDQGNWNQSGNGGQGVLYKCTATNTWTLFYTPFTYPHPLTISTATPSTTAPTVSISITH